MSKYIEKAELLTLPVLPMRGVAAFPGIPMSVEITNEDSIAACNSAISTNSFIFFVAQKEYDEDQPKGDDLHKVGTVVKIKQSLKTPEGHMRLLAEGVVRATATEYRRGPQFMTASVICKSINISDSIGLREEAYMREAIQAAEKIIRYLPAMPGDIIMAAKAIKSPGFLADFIASNMLVKFNDKQKILECFNPIKRIEQLTVIMESELKLLKCERDIHKKVHEQLDRNQRDYYLREQLRVIQSELGEGAGEADEYYEKISAADLPDEVKRKLLREADRLSKTNFGSAEGALLRNYIDICLEIPWNKTSRDRADIAAAKKVLDADHWGLDKVKERILEYLAVKQLNPELKNQIICLVGAPGVGKTSIASSIARAMKRKYVRVSLGGVRDEADIRGHRKTYIGAMAGRIINALTQAGTRNPLILLDEIDKLGQSAHGDPAAALLEALDGEQNKNFRDHFIEIPVDLSECLFITTAITLDTIPRPLIDRMEIIKLPTYTRIEKLQIAKNHLLPKQLKRHGLNKRTLKITDGTIYELIDYYTREAGVRTLERTIADLCRKAVKLMLTEGKKSVTIDAGDVAEFIGARKMRQELAGSEGTVGEVNGLAYTEYGGDLLKIEVSVLEGTGKLELTGSLGDVMKESAKAALSYARSVAGEFEIDSDFYKTKDIHIHVPDGAVPKDGPSAGIAMMTALISALSGREVCGDVAMTGEITLRGNVLPIGGLREKTMAAYASGIKRVIIPEENERNLEETDALVRESIQFIPCKRASEVLSHALKPKKLPSFREHQTEPPQKIAIVPINRGTQYIVDKGL